MASWRQFENSAPSLADVCRERFRSTDLVMLGTLRKDGRPRITPIEFFFFEDQLTIGGMWQSRKLADLQRDSRCVLHSTTSDKDGIQGDMKLYGAASEVTDEQYRERYGQALRAATGWRPEGRFHLFTVDISEAAFTVFGAGVGVFRPRLEGAPGVRFRVMGGDSPDTAAGYIVATWSAPA
jgi:Pyridoxamine 5'-phosphate oxidase